MKKIVFSISGLAKKHPRKYIKHVLDLKFINLKYKNFQNEKYLNSRFRKIFKMVNLQCPAPFRIVLLFMIWLRLSRIILYCNNGECNVTAHKNELFDVQRLSVKIENS